MYNLGFAYNCKALHCRQVEELTLQLEGKKPQGEEGDYEHSVMEPQVIVQAMKSCWQRRRRTFLQFIYCTVPTSGS